MGKKGEKLNEKKVWYFNNKYGLEASLFQEEEIKKLFKVLLSKQMTVTKDDETTEKELVVIYRHREFPFYASLNHFEKKTKIKFKKLESLRE